MEEDMKSKLKTRFGMIHNENRSQTFKNWPFENNSSCSKEKMAESGFFSTCSDTDAVECFRCGKQLDGWEENDDPWAEHLKHSKNCDFAKLRKAEDQLTVGQYIDFGHDCIKIQVSKLCDEKIQQVQDKFNQMTKQNSRKRK